MNSSVPSAACDAVESAKHPSPEAGGPCATCAFRPGTEANRSAHTAELARLCVEGFRFFYCHEQPQLCRGYLAAINVRGVPESEDDRRWSDVCGIAADLIADCISRAEADQERATNGSGEEASGFANHQGLNDQSREE